MYVSVWTKASQAVKYHVNLHVTYAHTVHPRTSFIPQRKHTQFSALQKKKYLSFLYMDL